MSRPFNEEGIEKLKNALLKREMTMSQLCEITGLSERQTYRWLEYLKEKGADIVLRQKTPATYQLIS